MKAHISPTSKHATTPQPKPAAQTVQRALEAGEGARHHFDLRSIPVHPPGGRPGNLVDTHAGAGAEACATCGARTPAPHLSRDDAPAQKCSSCERQAELAPNTSLESSRGHGLTGDERAFFEPKFGHDLKHVRVHDDSAAANRAARFGAAAFTYGYDVFLGPNHRPSSVARRQILAHELAHVLQYTGGGSSKHVMVGEPNAAAERDAELASQRVLAGQSAQVMARDAAPVVRRAVTAESLGKKCSPGHEIRVLQWMVHIGAIRERIKATKFAPYRTALESKLHMAEVMINAYNQCGGVKMVGGSGAVGLTTVPSPSPSPSPMPPPIMEPIPTAPMVEPVPMVEPAPGPGPGMGMSIGPGVAIALGTAALQWTLSRWTSSSSGVHKVTYDELKQIMGEIDADVATAEQAITQLEAQEVTEAAKKKQADAAAQTSADTDVDKDEKPDDEEPRSCDPTDTTCSQVPIPRKGGTSKYTQRHNRCADMVTIPSLKGKDVCINGKAFDAVDEDGVLWEIKAHAWSYATIYKDPKMAKRIARDIAAELLEELRIARKCGKQFKVGVRDAGLKTAIRKLLPGLKIKVLKC